MSLKLGKKDITSYYYALCLKSASLCVPVIRSGVAAALDRIHGGFKARLKIGYMISSCQALRSMLQVINIGYINCLQH